VRYVHTNLIARDWRVPDGNLVERQSWAP